MGTISYERVFDKIFLGPIRCILPLVSTSGYTFRFNFRSLFDVSYSDERHTKKAVKSVLKCSQFFVL